MDWGFICCWLLTTVCQWQLSRGGRRLHVQLWIVNCINFDFASHKVSVYKPDWVILHIKKCYWNLTCLFLECTEYRVSETLCKDLWLPNHTTHFKAHFDSPFHFISSTLSPQSLLLAILFVHIVYSRCQRQHIHSLISFVEQIPFGIMRNQAANRIISQKRFWVQTSQGIFNHQCTYVICPKWENLIVLGSYCFHYLILTLLTTLCIIYSLMM